MPLSSSLRVAGPHVVLEVGGDYTSAALLELRDIVAKASEEHGCGKVLLDLRKVRGLVSNMDRFVGGVYASQIWPRPLRVAIVLESGQIEKFFENTAYNRGVQTLVVTSEEEAIAWLSV